MHEQTQAEPPGRAARFRARALRHGLVLAAAAIALATASLATAATAEAARPLELGFTDFSDDLFVDPDPGVRSLWLDRASEAGAGMVLLGANWSGIAPQNPPASFDPRNPGDPGYSWGFLDAGVRDATAHGLKVMIIVTDAPAWAEGPKKPGNVAAGTWKPDPGHLADFGAAIASRYSGRFVDPSNPRSGALPRVRLWELWAEPNLSVNLTPQYESGKPFAPQHYRRMLDAFYSVIKAVDEGNRVVTGGLAPYGDPPGGARTRPLAFFRDMLCLRGRKQLRRAPCSPKPSFDVLAHNPINLSGGPRLSAVHPDDVSSADLKNVRRVLRAAERAHTIRPRGRHPLWATEFWWASNPPAGEGVSPQRQARRIEESLYLYWKAGASVAIMLQISDTEDHFIGGTGLYFIDGEPKPSLTAFRFPFVTERESRRFVRAWGRAPAAGKLRIERRSGGGWRTIKKVSVGQGSVFTAKLRVQGKAKLRAGVGADTSLVWSQRGARRSQADSRQRLRPGAGPGRLEGHGPPELRERLPGGSR